MEKNKDLEIKIVEKDIKSFIAAKEKTKRLKTLIDTKRKKFVDHFKSKAPKSGKMEIVKGGYMVTVSEIESFPIVSDAVSVIKANPLLKKHLAGSIEKIEIVNNSILEEDISNLIDEGKLTKEDIAPLFGHKTQIRVI